MDALLAGFHGLMNGSEVGHTRSHKPAKGFVSPLQSYDSNLSSTSSSDGDSLETHANSTILKYISEILMEEDDLYSKAFMFHDSLALQAAEKSFYEVLHQRHPPPPNQTHGCKTGENPDDDSQCSSNSESLHFHHSLSLSGSSLDASLVSNSFWGKQSDVGFRRENGNLVFSTNENSETMSKSVSNPTWLSQNGIGTGKPEDRPPNGARKSFQRGDDGNLEEGRSSKHSAVFVEDSEPPEIFDKVLLYHGENPESKYCMSDESLENSGNKKNHRSKQSRRSSGKANRSKKQEGNQEVVDLWSLLTHCAQAVAIYDQRTATEALKQIRNNSSALGNGTQRLAHYFANGLETRLTAGKLLYMPVAGNELSAAEILKGYQVYITASPFKRLSNRFANRTILKLAAKATSLHIIDFGILYGFQWPCLIKLLAARPGGPPELRITGIEFPQPGFRPTERVEETGRRLGNYCKRFKVPFQYKVIAQKWETIKLEDLKVDKDEMTVVNCIYHMKNIPDETVAESCPRDIVLSLIKKINPDLVIHGVVNGTYNAPFFMTRFREALFHFSALFDMFDATVSRDDYYRHMFEKGVFGRDAMNVVACEGIERVERPETYKQWQVRHVRAGLRQTPLDQEILKEVKEFGKRLYHEDFLIDVDGHWLLQGWKGRILHALSCWVPA